MKYELIADLIGVPFVEFGRNPKTGLDCYGLAIEVCRRYGKKLNDVVLERFDRGKVKKTLPQLNVKKTDTIKDCCILEFYGIQDNRLHVGIALDKKTFIHATESQGVRISSLSFAQNYLKLDSIYEVI